MQILHHGALDGVTGSCHQLRLDSGHSILVDCGLFQGDEARGRAGAGSLAIEFPLDGVAALVVTHVHIDHVGRIPWLIAAGFRGPILCSEPSALLLPLVLEDAFRLGVSRDEGLLNNYMAVIKQRIVPLAYGHWRNVDPLSTSLAPPNDELRIRLKPAGHILGSAYVECDLKERNGNTRVVFSGDLGAPHAPLLPAPKSPYGADVVVLESTYGDRLHEGRRTRSQRLKSALERALSDKGVVLIPAFSIGRTQEVLYEIEGIIHSAIRKGGSRKQGSNSGLGLDWQRLNIVVDSPLAARFTEAYRQLKPFWDKEAHQRLRQGRHPLAFEQLTTIDSHRSHQRLVSGLAQNPQPLVIIAASGMCAGGRIVNYLKALLGNPTTDLLLIGYQARGTPGADIQRYGPKGGYVMLDGERVTIKAEVTTLSGYSAHADQANLVNFIQRMRKRPREVRLVHGDAGAKAGLKIGLQEIVNEVVIP
ncbi:MBL fold metallo-hydrolase RNA specificity domain-containing protein [Aestuariirhabdus sp. LZHN29]|uniref:MBL fold metallo-hydrolase RNA specificity domain-containing protein n=1 Tax=Aestuariirhabdus sp. LZHN29 TaxID=3417462 RepID=UPI003CF1445B